MNKSGQLNAWVKASTRKKVDEISAFYEKLTGIRPTKSQVIERAILELARKVKV